MANKMGFQKRMTYLYALDHESALQLGEPIWPGWAWQILSVFETPDTLCGEVRLYTDRQLSSSS